MRILFPGLAAATALIAAPAAAQTQSQSGPSGGSDWSSQSAFGDRHGDGRHGRHDRDRKFRDGRDRFAHQSELVAVTHTYGGEWALYNNRSWAPDSYNDWWHDRPDRAYPRWLQNNQKCERVWWSGGGWRC